MNAYCYLLLLLLFSSSALAESYMFNWTEYQDLDKINNYMDKLKKDHSDSVTVIEIGKTYEKRSIKVLRIGLGDLCFRKAVVIQAGLSPNAWVNVATATYVMDQLFNSQYLHIQHIAQRYVWYIAPVLNPDGYVHTWTKDRDWSLNRQPYDKCFGADLTKNFNFQWLYYERDSNCEGSFAGFHPQSEVETRYWSRFLKKLPHHLFAYFEFSNYGEKLNYVFTHNWPPNKEEYTNMGSNAVKVAAHRYGTKFTLRPALAAYGIATGWIVKNFPNITLALSYKQRGKSHHLPPNQIYSAAAETFDSLVSLILQAEELTADDFDDDHN